MSELRFFHRGAVGDCCCWEGSDPDPLLFSRVMTPKKFHVGEREEVGRIKSRVNIWRKGGGGGGNQRERQRYENTGSILFAPISSSSFLSLSISLTLSPHLSRCVVTFHSSNPIYPWPPDPQPHTHLSTSQH